MSVSYTHLKFDEINRLSAPVAEKTAASAKEKQAAQAAAKAAKSAAGTTAGSTRRSGKAGTDAAEFSAVWQDVYKRQALPWMAVPSQRLCSGRMLSYALMLTYSALRSASATV